MVRCPRLTAFTGEGSGDAVNRTSERGCSYVLVPIGASD